MSTPIIADSTDNVESIRALLVEMPHGVETVRTSPEGEPLDWPSATLTIAGHIIRIEMPHAIPGPEVNATYYNVSVDFEACHAEADTFSMLAAEVAAVARIVAWLDNSDDPFAAFEEITGSGVSERIEVRCKWAHFVIDPEFAVVAAGDTHRPYVALTDQMEEGAGETLIYNDEVRELAYALLRAIGEEAK